MTGDDGVFGERLRACRAAAGLSQEELAERSGVSVRAIRDMERGRTRWPNYDSTRRLADSLRLADQDRDRFLMLARRPVPGSAESGQVAVPYRGLSAFGEQDAGMFFGREEAAARVLELISGALGGAGLVLVSGVSGAGKSSLLAAGVLPRLRQAGLAGAPEAAAWPVLVFTPGPSPLTELAVRIAPLARADAAALRQQLAADPAGFAMTARQAALVPPVGPAGERPPGGLANGVQRRVVLVVDQCEQLFTACPDPQERQAFVTALCAAAAGDAAGQCPAAVVVLVTRADFEARLADFPHLNAAVQDRYLLTAMTRRQLRLAITRPAIAAGSAIEEDLLQVLLEEAAPAPASGAAGAGALPLLSHVLDQAWRTRTGTAVTLTDYDRAGGIEGAVAASAQRAYQALTPAQQEIARQVFTRLTAAGPDGTDTVVSAARGELTASGEHQAADVEAVLEKFAAERLLTLDAGTVQISHEVLLTAWPLLRDDWLADARADRITRTRLHATATDWAQASRDPSYLYSGSRLEAAVAAVGRIGADPRQPPFCQADHDFLRASHRAGRRRVRARRQLTALLLALIAALTTVSIIAERDGQTAATQRDTAASRLLISQSQALADTNPTAARRYSLAAWAMDKSPQARLAMIQTAANPEAATILSAAGWPSEVTFSPDGTTLAIGSGPSVQLWNPVTDRQSGPALTEPNSSRVEAVVFSPDGKTLAVSSDAGTWLWEVATRRPMGRPLPAAIASFAVAFSPDGRILATAGPDGAQLWDLATRTKIGPLLLDRPRGIMSLAFSPNGRILATGGWNHALLWNVATRRQIGSPLSGDGAETSSNVVFSPNGSILATGGGAGVQLWDVANHRRVGRALGAGIGGPVSGPPWVPGMAFNPDGSILATSSGAGVQLWDVASGTQIGVPLTDGNDGPISSIAFSPDGKAIAAANRDRVRLWELTAAPFRQLDPSPSPRFERPASVAFSPDGKILAVITGKRVHLWDAFTSRPAVKPFATTPSAATAFVPGRTTAMLATVNPADSVQFLNITTILQAGMQPATLAPSEGSLLPFIRSDVNALAFSRDGTILATSSDQGVQLWDLATGGQIGTLINGNPDPVDSLAFSPDGTMLATSAGVTVQLWEVVGKHFGRLLATLAHGAVSSVAFSPDGTKLATGSDAGAQLWDVDAGRQFGRHLATLADSRIHSVAFSPDGKTLATSGDQGVQLWDVATSRQIGVTLTYGNGDPVDSLAFSPDGTILAATGPDGTALWNTGYLAETVTQRCAQAGGSFTPAEWARYVGPGTLYRNACPPTRG